jgi:hypothetical protein
MPKRRAFEQLTFSLLLRQLEELRRRCESAVHALPAEKRGAAKSAEISRWLVSKLDAILYTHTGHHISRSRKRPGYEGRYIELCFAAANPEMGSGSIDKAMQFYIQLGSGTRNE